ncbi:TPA: XRE family transcriptional regulator [Candidatus Gastranaerophilales bacterium HUM_6]|jgi:transcriptional regulator with XRE-family HTH domain|nr:transcriptional regulator XRE family [Fusobacterium sp. CAG:815]DAA92507.1 MAG TPA: XRE family transcriptional regulator [Candidatus Gastranaerophilales bacterium HUM_6]DAA93130.1 MAG TPA: XRE family transcriptional regulator [Candidatus Gastranaerophilales bacterium HUM_7]DAA99813.1 MAG TPA: XRE family transcriptional regulator [Candidatus Gastranaerophilales bacterium HUM_12]DAB05510.1 MAG TPA: XRE family transcriptional regulator [Candidatus Gastranaerophilales bacterium HUM_14]
MDNKKKLGLKIKELRKRKGLTQEQLAELIDMEQNSISVIESGRNFPTLGTLEKIAQILEVNLSDFFNYDYIDDIETIKASTKDIIRKMDDNQIRQLFKYVKSI